MKRHSYTFISIVIIVMLMGYSSTNKPIPDNKLKVMTYNIWNGFDWGKDPQRKHHFVEWVKTKSPDVLALQELCGYDEAQLKADAAKWGHPYVKILKTTGYPTGLTSRKPIEVVERQTADLWHGLLHCKTYGIDFYVVHLSPKDCNFRLKEASIISDKLKNRRSDDYIILGDFNTHSPFDDASLKNNKQLLKKYAGEHHDKYSNLRLGTFDYAPMSRFLAIPSIDICNRFLDSSERFTYPSPVLIGKYRKSMDDVIQTRERIDYILTSPSIAKTCTDVSIYNTGKTTSLSDHYPIMAEFDLATK